MCNVHVHDRIERGTVVLTRIQQHTTRFSLAFRFVIQEDDGLFLIQFESIPYHSGQSRISRCSFWVKIWRLLTFHWLKQRTFLHFFCQGTKITANSATSRCLTGKQSWISRGSCFETSLSRCAIELHSVLHVSLCVCAASPLAWKSRVSGKISELYIHMFRSNKANGAQSSAHKCMTERPNAECSFSRLGFNSFGIDGLCCYICVHSSRSLYLYLTQRFILFVDMHESLSVLSPFIRNVNLLFILCLFLPHSTIHSPHPLPSWAALYAFPDYVLLWLCLLFLKSFKCQIIKHAHTAT